MDVIGFDNPVMDFVIQVEKIPPSNGHGVMQRYSWQGGGNVGSAMVASARLGASVGMVGVVGDDPYGCFCINDFRRHGIDTSHIIIDKDMSTNFCVALAETSTGLRTFIHTELNLNNVPIDKLDKNYIASSKFIHTGAFYSPTILQAIKIAKANKVKVCMDAGGFDAEMDKYIDMIDIFIASEFYYEALFDNKNYKENCAKLQSRGHEIVIITLGEKGCVGMQDGRYFEIPAFDVPVIDTTGAGDVFHGAFIYGLLQGWNAEETALFSSAVSAIKCTRLGGRVAIPDRAMVDRFLQDRYIDYSSIDERARFYQNGLSNLGGKIL